MAFRLLLTATALALAACGGGGEGSSGPTTTEWTGYTSTTEQWMPECPPEEMIDPAFRHFTRECEMPEVVWQEDADAQARVAALAEVARADGADTAAEILDDGQITVAELRQAYQDSLDCMAEGGMDVLHFAEYEGLYGTDFTFLVGRADLTEDEANVVNTLCDHQHLNFVMQANQMLTSDRFTERARAVLQECMADHGVTDDIGHTMDELREVSPNEQATNACVAEAEQKPPLPDDLPLPPGGP